MMFGAAVDGDGNPLYEVVTCGLTAERVASTNGFDIVPAAGAEALVEADTVIVPGTRYAQPRGHALEVRRRAAAAAPQGASRRAGAVRRRRRRAQLGGPCRGNRLVPAHHSCRSWRAGGQRGGPLLRGAAVARGRTGAVHRSASANRRRRVDGRHPRVGAAPSRRRADRRATGQACTHERADVQPPVHRGDRSGAGNVDPQPPHRPRPRAARVARSVRRRGRQALRPRLRGQPTTPPAPRRRYVAVELPQGLSGRLTAAGAVDQANGAATAAVTRSAGRPARAHASPTASAELATKTQKMTSSEGTANVKSTLACEPSADMAAAHSWSLAKASSIGSSASSARYHSTR